MTATLPLSAAPTVRIPRMAVAGGIALVGNLIAFAVGSAAGATWRVGQPYPVSILAVVSATVIAFSVGSLAAWALARWKPLLVKVAAWVGIAVGLLSTVSLLNAADWATGMSLASMHLMTTAAWAVGLLGAKAVQR